MKSDPRYIVKAPLLTEESTIQTETRNQYTFRVNPKANKIQIREAIEQMFNVHVVAVNTMNYSGKCGSRGRRGNPGQRSNWKKAVVTLRAGDKIELI